VQSYDYSQVGHYFITICTKNRENIFGDVQNGNMDFNSFGKIANEYWEQIGLRFPQCRLHEFVVMPNHIHGIIEIISNPKPMETIHELTRSQNDQLNSEYVGTIHELSLRNTKPSKIELNRKKRRKMMIPMIIGWYKMNVSKRINIIRKTEGYSIWQRNYYEHIIRNQKSFENISDYIRRNPQKWDNDRFF
jgi:REP element-mobilizing transposase RayT